MAVITNGFLVTIMNLVKNDLNYIGIGAGSTPQPTDTLLDAELSRKTATEYIDGMTVVKEAYWSETELNGQILTNAGLFCNGATSSIGTGQVAAADVINIVKDSTQTLTVSVEVTFEGVG